jgi:hypothetical protein
MAYCRPPLDGDVFLGQQYHENRLASITWISLPETDGEPSGTGQLSEGMSGERATQASLNGGHTAMSYTGYVKGNVVILKEPLAVPDGTEVEIVIPPAKSGRPQGRGKSSVVQATFGIIPSDPAMVHAVLEEDLYET